MPMVTWSHWNVNAIAMTGGADEMAAIGALEAVVEDAHPLRLREAPDPASE